MEQNKKMNFFKRIFYAVKDFEKYQKFALENKAIALRYIMKLVSILTLVITLCFMFKFTSLVKQGIKYFRNDFPDLYFSNNELTVNTDTPIIYELSEQFNGIIIVDTSAEFEENYYKDKLNIYENGIIFLKNNVILKNVNGLNTYNYSSIADLYGVQNFTKQDLEGYLTNKNVYSFYLSVFMVMFLYMYLIYLITTLVDAVMLAVFGFLSSRISRIPLKFSAIYKMSLYAVTLPIILNIIYVIINSTTGFVIEYFDWMYTAISFIYLITAILMIKSDMIKQQMELLRLEEEQKRIREEQKRKEEEEKERLEQEKREKEKEKEKEKNKKEGKSKQDPAPEGT